ncbi:MAG: polyprenyl synthetase family protein [Candidatus Aenigmarchaeota archaeon]|nr:polyprenyl synthetase family protein [Candidatus Aenigmarchaeota archaeon]
METPPVPRDFKSFVALYKETVYNKICEYLPKGEPEAYHKIVRCYVDRKGQYRRPSYLLLWNLLYGGRMEDAILPAAVQQTSEDWILMHDDIMDGNSLRRGQPAAHVLFGLNYAVLGGDHLHMMNWRMAHEAAEKLGKDRGRRYFDKFFDIMHVTHEGQYLDMRLTHDVKDITKFTPEDYFKSIHAKAAYYTVYGPMQCGAIIAGAPEEVVNSMAEYGVSVGNAFQIKDDILDCTSTEAVLGKSIGNDVRDGVKTIVLWHAVQNAPADILAKLKAIYAKPREQKTEDEVKWILEKFKELGSISYAEKEAARLAGEAAKRFDKQTKDMPESPLKQLARESIGYVVKRKE